MDANELVGDLVGSPIKGAVSGLSGSLFGYIAAGIGVVVGGLVIWLWLVYGQLEKAELRVNEQKALVALKDAQIGGFVESIGRQNELINKLAVDTKEGIDEMKKNAGKVETSLQGLFFYTSLDLYAKCIHFQRSSFYRPLHSSPN